MSGMYLAHIWGDGIMRSIHRWFVCTWGQTQLYYEGDLEAEIEMMESEDYEERWAGFSRQKEEHVQRSWVGMTILVWYQRSEEGTQEGHGSSQPPVTFQT